MRPQALQAIHSQRINPPRLQQAAFERIPFPRPARSLLSPTLSAWGAECLFKRSGSHLITDIASALY